METCPQQTQSKGVQDGRQGQRRRGGGPAGICSVSLSQNLLLIHQQAHASQHSTPPTAPGLPRCPRALTAGHSDPSGPQSPKMLGKADSAPALPLPPLNLPSDLGWAPPPGELGRALRGCPCARVRPSAEAEPTPPARSRFLPRAVPAESPGCLMERGRAGRAGGRGALLLGSWCLCKPPGRPSFTRGSRNGGGVPFGCRMAGDPRTDKLHNDPCAHAVLLAGGSPVPALP